MRKLVARIMMLMFMTAFVLSIVPTPAKAASVPGVPTAFTVTSPGGTVTLAWSEPADDGGSVITGYRIYRGLMEDGLGIVEDVTDMLYTDTGVSTGQTYYYAVSALNAEGEGEKTEALSVTPEASSPLMTLIYVEDYTTFVIINIGEGVYFDIAGERHNVTVVSITGTSTLITVSSGFQNFTMKEGDSENVDVNSDGTDDYVITCKTINSVAQTVEFSFTTASKKSGGGIPGFELWTMVVGGLLALYVLNHARAEKSLSPSRIQLVTLLTTLLLVLSLSPTSAMAIKPDTKMVDTVVGSYTIDGTTVKFVSHITGIIKWIVEPTDYIEWPESSGQLIPVDGEFRVKTSSFEHDKLFWDDSHISITSSGSKYVGTFEIVETLVPEFPWLPPYMPMPKDGIMNTHTLTKFYGEPGTTKNHLIVKYAEGVPTVTKQKLLLPPQPKGRGTAPLTGFINDYGLDTDENSLYDYLVISIEVRIQTPGYYTVEVFDLLDSSSNRINVYGTNSLYLNQGTHFVDVSLDGPTIYVSGFNPSMVASIRLYDESFNSLGSMTQIPLSREYSLEEFERPAAILTGEIYDEGIDTDGDGTFDYLKVGVLVYVYSPGIFGIRVPGLFDSTHNTIDVWSETPLDLLDEGVNVIYVYFSGPTIYASGFDPASVIFIDLYDESYNWLDFLFDVPLSRVYSHTEFDLPPARLTGIIYDEGVDTDGDGTFDYLMIDVEVEVSEAGTYTVEMNYLLDEWGNYILVWSSNTLYLEAGTQIVYLQLDGPSIYMQGLNPNRVSSLTLYDADYYDLGSVKYVPLSTTYLHTQFDA